MPKITLLICFLALILIGRGNCFLMNSTHDTAPYGYQNLVGLIMDEKMSRYQLENRLNNMEHSYAQIMKELQKDRNNRQQLIDENTKLNLQLSNVTTNLNALESRHEKLLSKHDSLKTDFEKLKFEHQILENDTSKLADANKFVEEKVENLTNGQELLANKYHVLLEQYLTVTSHNQNTFVDKHLFTTELQKLDHRLLDMDNNLTAKVDQNRQKIKQNGKQLGFSMEKVNKTSNMHRLKFITTRYNSENMFNTSSGEFVCRLAGLYSFTATIVREPGITESYCFMYVNNIAIVGTVGYGSSTTGYASGTTAFVYHLNVGDKVYIGYCHGIDHMYGTSSFSGFLIAPDQ